MAIKTSILLVATVVSSALHRIALLPFKSSAALEASWVPSATYDSTTIGESGPLPLSKAYRDKLRKLCILVNNSGSEGHIKDDERRRELQKMCRRLKKDDSYSSSANSRGIASPTNKVSLVNGNYKLLSSTGAIVAVAITGFVSSIIFYGYSYCWSYFMELAKTVRLIL